MRFPLCGEWYAVFIALEAYDGILTGRALIADRPNTQRKTRGNCMGFADVMV